MENELTNLLPPERQRTLAREYMLRLGVVTVVLVTGLVIVSGLLLVPTYLLLTQSAGTKQVRLTNIETALSSADEKTLLAQLTSLSNQAATLTALRGAPSASAIIRTALAVPRPGVSINELAYTPAGKNIPGTLAISGTAATRGALRNYQLALQNSSFAAAADLPVSAFAKDADISFSITVMLSP